MPDDTIAVNRRARHDYAIEETLEAGIVLTGTEIKSVREHRVNIAEAYVRMERGEASLVGAHIAEFAQGNRNSHAPTRTRKLLLHRDQITELLGLQSAKGLTMVPLKMDRTLGVDKTENRGAVGEGADDRAAEDVSDTRCRQARDRRGARQEGPRQATFHRRARHAPRARPRVQGSGTHQALERVFTSAHRSATMATVSVRGDVR